MNKLLFLLGAFIYSSAAFASDIYMVKLSAQETGKQVWDLGIQTDKHDSIAGIVYREPNGEVLSFPLETTNRKAKVVLRIAVYDIVSLKTKVLGSQKI